jgi:two-component system nitrate/nitrite sensor histidine kinase NarX
VSLSEGQTQSEDRRRLRRWILAGLILVIVLIYLIIESTLLVRLSSSAWILLDVLILMAFGLVVFWGVGRISSLSSERTSLQKKLDHAENQLAEAYERNKTIFHISQMFAEARDQDQVVELILRLSMEFVGADGASFVPLDERSQPLEAMSIGEIPFPVAEAWIEYLASPKIRELCGSCQEVERLTHTCPLLIDTFKNTKGVYCYSLNRGDQEYGILNLYLPRNEQFDPDMQAVLRTILDETTKALESVRLRERAISTLSQFQYVQEKTDLNVLFSGLLDNLCGTFDADFALVTIWEGYEDKSKEIITSGDLPENTEALVEGILQSVVSSKEPVIIGKVSGNSDSPPGFRSFMATPLISHGKDLKGVLLVANKHVKAFTNQQLSFLQTVAGQVALVVQNVDLMAKLEYRSMMDERTRLAREIHDGLAQTLGFLKLKTAQSLTYLERGEIDLTKETVKVCHDVLSDTYQDARQAIDGLRITPSEDGWAGWLAQTVAEFKDYNDISVSIHAAELLNPLAPEIQAQLIRIVQEALNNIRKHAHASKIEISCFRSDVDIAIEIWDNGIGFLAEDVPNSSQHGLRGMRERAELIGADFHVTSQTQRGTTVRVGLPITIMEQEA